MTCIHENKVNKISECNLIHDIINPPKRTENINSNYYPILHVYMNTRRGRFYVKTYQMLLCIRCSYTVVMGSLGEKLKLEKYSVIQWRTQVGHITTNLRVKVYFTLPALSATNVVTWKCHVDDSAKDRHFMIFGRDLLI